jgi:hypothetical protein
MGKDWLVDGGYAIIDVFSSWNWQRRNGEVTECMKPMGRPGLPRSTDLRDANLSRRLLGTNGYLARLVRRADSSKVESLGVCPRSLVRNVVPIACGRIGFRNALFGGFPCLSVRVAVGSYYP